MSNIDDEVKKKLQEAVGEMPDIIRSALFGKQISATNTLKWTELAVRLHRGPVGRPLTDIERQAAREVRQILRDARPLLENIHKGHTSERLRRKAEQYLKIIAVEVQPD